MNNSSTKNPQLLYRVVEGRNPRTGGVLRRPAITERQNYDMAAVVDYAIRSGFVLGRSSGVRGTLEGLLEAIREILCGGASVTLNGYLHLSGELSGSLDEDCRITDANEYHMCATALKRLKLGVGDFTWKRVKA